MDSTAQPLQTPAARPVTSLRRRLRHVSIVLKVLPILAIVALAVWARFLRPVAAEHTTVVRGELKDEVFGRGTIESPREADLGFDLSGRLSDITVDEGDRVSLGQVLGHLAPQQYDAELRTAQSSASVARAALARLDAEQRRAAANLAFASAEAQRAHSLAKSGSVPPRDLDVAEQQLALAAAEVERVKAARGEASRAIEVARGGIELQRAVAQRTALVSPFDGLVIRRFKDPGDTVTVGTTVLRVVATDRLWVRASIDETALPRLSEGQRAEVAFPGDRTKTYEGVVDRIGREADRQTHEVLVDIRLSTLPERIAIGQRADAWIELERRESALMMPLAFVARGPGSTHAYVSQAGRVKRVPIVIGPSGRGTVEVVSGVSDGDVVLKPTSDSGDLQEGRRWKPASGS